MAVFARLALLAGLAASCAIGCSLLLGDGYTGGAGASDAAVDAPADTDAGGSAGDAGVTCAPNAALDDQAPWPMPHGCLSNIGQSALAGPRSSPVIKWTRTSPTSRNFGPLTLSSDKILVGVEHDLPGVLAYSFAGDLAWPANVDNSCCGGVTVAAGGTLVAGVGGGLAFLRNGDGGIVREISVEGEADTAPVLTNDGAIYIGTSAGTKSGLYAFRTPNYDLAWSVRTTAAVGTPAVSRSGRLFFATQEGIVRGVSPDGTVVWTRDIARPTRHTVVTDESSVFVIAQDGTLVALGIDGSPRWELDTGGPPPTSPVGLAVAIANDGTLYVPTATGLVALRPDGVKRWSYLAAGRVVASPVIDSEGTIFVASLEGFVHAVAPDGSARWAPVAYTRERASSVVVGPDRRLYVASYFDPTLQAFGEP